MEGQSEYPQHHKGREVFPHEEMAMKPYSRVKKKGRWSFEEHQTFINCLKKYGKNWDNIEEMVPSRTSIQIRSHCQKYFDQIKKDFNIDDPMKYVLKDMADATPLYQFEKPQKYEETRNSIDPHATKMSGKESRFRPEVIGSSNSQARDKYPSAMMKKRDLKYAEKSLGNSLSSTMYTKKILQNSNSLDSSTILSKIENIRKKTESFSCLNPYSNDAIEEEFAKPKCKSQMKEDESQLKIKKGCNLLALGEGKIILQAERIESLTPLQYRKVNGEINMIIPEYPCEITIVPLNQAETFINPKFPHSQLFINSHQKVTEATKFGSYNENAFYDEDPSSCRVPQLQGRDSGIRSIQKTPFQDDSFNFSQNQS
ncbi:unnamed protein product [Moneuplotes crassus]|uniref:Uncharacterized protein n=1 Tax=Euplotes crassus TaxID=5936 RepID=A0AAD1UET0_EUPCR|nr:unnamed protein product [Moneuplotes crassus]